MNLKNNPFINLNEAQENQLEKLMFFVLEKNKECNLTAITDQKEFHVKHFLDSLAGFPHIPNHASVVDIGSGAGFPALVLKIANSTLQIVMIDSVRKKVDFLNQVIQQLSLTNIQAIHTRVEDFAATHFEQFDVCTSRAVAPLSTLLEYSLPLVKLDGKMIAYKGPNAVQEINLCKNTLKVLGGKVQNIIELEIEDNQRNILIIQKEKHAPKGYPRGGNKPRNNPLN